MLTNCCVRNYTGRDRGLASAVTKLSIGAKEPSDFRILTYSLVTLRDLQRGGVVIYDVTSSMYSQT